MEFKCLDGNSACAEMAYYLSELSAIYPITPSSTMAELVDEWSQSDRKNIFNQNIIVREMQSEAGVSGALHGAVQTGSLATTFTASQGLLLMIPNMYKIAGECLPCVFHVSARAVASHALSIFGDHSDVMAVRSTGFIMISSSSVQECYDMALASHIITLKASLPVLHFFDGFRTSHEIQKICTISEENIKQIYPFEKLQDFKNRAMTPQNPVLKGSTQNPDVFFQNRERANILYKNTLKIVEETFLDIQKISKRNYKPYEYYGAQDAEFVVVLMGSAYQTVQETVDILNKMNKKVGVINVRLFRPFFSSAFCNVISTTTKKLCVLDRTKESGSVGEPLYLDVSTAVKENNLNVEVLCGRYGIGGKEFDINHATAVFLNMIQSPNKNHFTVGINDDVTNTSLQIVSQDFKDDDCIELKFYGLGSDGTVSATKNSIKIIGEDTNKYVQGYFEYDSKKSGSLTTSHIRISDKPIRKEFRTNYHDLIAIHNFTFIAKYNLIKTLKQDGIVLLNTNLNQNNIESFLPKEFVEILKSKNAQLYVIDAYKIAEEVGLGRKINLIMQTAFFKLLKAIPFEKSLEQIKQLAIKTYSKKGDQIVAKNIDAINKSINQLQKINYSSFSNFLKEEINTDLNYKFFDDVILPIEKMNGDELPVSKFQTDGSMPTNTSKYLKRGISLNLPKWIKENCIQCGFCSLSCPHSAIRSLLFKNDGNIKEEFESLDATGMKGYKFKIQLSPLDCTGCGVCTNVCPAINKALKMVENEEIIEREEENFNYSQTLNLEPSIFNKYTAKGLQFFQPYFEYNSACAGCGETPYIKILTQLFGDKMIIANATGCSSIYGGSYPVCPYTKDKNGHGPAWSNSLFEDNAEYGYGMAISQNQSKRTLNNLIKEILPTSNQRLNDLLTKWQNNLNCSYEEQEEIVEHLEKLNSLKAKEICLFKDSFVTKSIWIIGGDGWAYDIGYGGLDHILSSNENVNVMVLDSEVYSNTGGQSSKSTPKASIVKFNANGKTTKKKDLGAICMANKNCYVASVSLGADINQTIKALKEAEEFNGPSIVICYAPCINHGFDMSKSNEHMKLCVESGYWNLYRYNPKLNNPLSLDSKEPTKSYEDFLMTETRYSSLLKKDKHRAMELFEQSKKDAEERRQNLLNIIKLQNNE